MTRPRDLSRDHARILLSKARQDERLLDAVLDNRTVDDEVFGFHCQQAAEKLIKSALSARGVAYRRVHDIETLLQMCEDAGISFPAEFREANLFTGFAVEYRYADWPGDPGELEREEALDLVRAMRRWAEKQAG